MWKGAEGPGVCGAVGATRGQDIGRGQGAKMVIRSMALRAGSQRRVNERRLGMIRLAVVVCALAVNTGCTTLTSWGRDNALVDAELAELRDAIRKEVMRPCFVKGLAKGKKVTRREVDGWMERLAYEEGEELNAALDKEARELLEYSPSERKKILRGKLLECLEDATYFRGVMEAFYRNLAK